MPRATKLPVKQPSKSHTTSADAASRPGIRRLAVRRSVCEQARRAREKDSASFYCTAALAAASGSIRIRARIAASRTDLSESSRVCNSDGAACFAIDPYNSRASAEARRTPGCESYRPPMRPKKSRSVNSQEQIGWLYRLLGGIE